MFSTADLRDWPLIRWAALIFIVSFASRGAVLLVYYKLHPHHPLEDTEIGRVAIQVGWHHRFADPYSAPTGPTAHVAPVYPLLTSLWVGLLGTGNLSGFATCFCNMLFVSAGYGLMPLLARTCSVPLAVGVAAGLFPAAIPFSAIVELRLSESPLVFLLLVVITIFAIHILRHQQFSNWKAAGFGALSGLLLLTSPVGLTVLAGFFAVGLYFSVKFGKLYPYLRFTALAALMASLILSPWILRNYHTFGHLFFIRSNFGLEFKLSNHDGASPLLEVNEGTEYFYRNHPFWNHTEADRVKSLGEIEYNRQALQSALTWIKNRPASFLKLTLERFVFFWFMPGWPPFKALILFPLVLLAVWGAFRMIQCHPVAGATLAMVPLLFPVVYYFVQVSNRYRLPMYWTLYFFASYALISLRDKKRQTEGTAPKSPRLPGDLLHA